MPPRQKKRRRADRHVNVFVQESAPSGRDEMGDDDDALPAGSADDGAASVGATKIASASRTRRLRAQRVAGHARARSEIFTRSLGNELRKLGVLTGGIVVILVVLSFVL